MTLKISRSRLFEARSAFDSCFTFSSLVQSHISSRPDRSSHYVRETSKSNVPNSARPQRSITALTVQSHLLLHFQRHSIVDLVRQRERENSRSIERHSSTRLATHLVITQCYVVLVYCVPGLEGLSVQVRYCSLQRKGYHFFNMIFSLSCHQFTRREHDVPYDGYSDRGTR